MHLTPRERVLTAIRHEEPDRVPLSLWGSWYGITDELYFNVLDTLGWEPVPPFRPACVHSVNYYDDRLLELLQVDVRHVDPGTIAAYSVPRADDTDAFGIKWETRGPYRSPARHPLRESSAEQICEYPFPDPDQLMDTTGISERIKTIGAMDREYAIVGRAVASYGFFEMAQALRGPERFLMDLALTPDLVNSLVSRLYGCYAGLTERFLDVAGERLDIIELPGDDFAGNTGPLISPDMFDQFFKEPYSRLISLIKNHSPHVKVVYHSDGAMTALLPKLIEIGADVFHSVEPLPAWNLREVKDQYGDRIAFMGGIDIRAALQGDEADVEIEVKTRLRELAPGGGYLLAPANHLQSDVPPQNLFALYGAATNHGKYPLHVGLD
jgi:uroporphyrinogen decarboxylase